MADLHRAGGITHFLLKILFRSLRIGSWCLVHDASFSLATLPSALVGVFQGAIVDGARFLLILILILLVSRGRHRRPAIKMTIKRLNQKPIFASSSCNCVWNSAMSCCEGRYPCWSGIKPGRPI